MLPKIDLPTYVLKLPSTNQEITVRPFLVKEEKLLLMAVKSDDAQEIIRATKQVISNCIISPEIDIDKLPFFDIDYLFIALRAKSIGENIELNFICQTNTETGKCGNKFPVKLDIANIEVLGNDSSKLEIKFNDNLIFYMKYPSYSIIKSLDDKDDTLEKNIKIIASCIDRIFNNGQFYTSKDFTPDELKAFIENLTQQQYSKLEEFTQNFPSFVVKASGTCNKCGKQHSVRYKDFISFFQ